MRIVILGCGLSGMCAALRLRDSGLDSEIVILEKEGKPGGLLQTTRINGHYWDHGVFLFLSNNYMLNLLPDLLQVIPEGSQQKIWLEGSIRDFPLDKGMLKTLSKPVLLGIAFDYIYSLVRCWLGCDGKSVQDWMRYRITSKLLRFSRLDQYVTKMQGLPATQISATIGETRLQGLHEATRPLQLMRLVLSSRRKMQQRMQPYEFYPYHGGIGRISEEMSRLCDERSIRIICGSPVQRVVPVGDAGYEVQTGNGEASATYCADYVISTIPLEELAAASKDRLSEYALACAKDLSYLNLKLMFLLINRPSIFHDFFVLYSFEPHHRWKRLLAVAQPGGMTTVTIEIGFKPEDGLPGPDVDEAVIRQLTDEVRLFSRDEIVEQHTAVVNRAYPVYRLEFEKNVRRLMEELESSTFRVAGRQGRFLYVSTPGSIQSGHEAAEKILAAAAACSPNKLRADPHRFPPTRDSSSV